jgi:hypothetical protein
MPLRFEATAGQAAVERFQARAADSTYFLGPTEVVVAFDAPLPARPTTNARLPAHGSVAPAAPPPQVLRRRFIGANPAAHLSGETPWFGAALGAGAQPAGRARATAYTGVRTPALYPGVDLVWSGLSGQLQSAYIFAPGADPRVIQWRYEGASGVQIDAGGHLRIAPGGPAAHSVIEYAPRAWQDQGERRVPVRMRYTLSPDGIAGFAPGLYEPDYPLMIETRE